MNIKLYTLLLTCLFVWLATANAQYNHSDSAFVSILNATNHCHKVSFAFDDPNSPCNIFIPLADGDYDSWDFISQNDTLSPLTGRGNGILIYKPKLTDTMGFSGWRYTYGPDNFGQFQGGNVSKATKLVIWLKGKGTIEIIVGGTNRRPYYDDSLPFSDGVDARSTGYIELQDTNWTKYELDLTDHTFYALKGVGQGIENRFPAPAPLDDNFDCIENLEIIPESQDETGYPCFEVVWEKPITSMCWAGFFNVIPGIEKWWLDNVQGYELTGLDTIIIRAKMSKPGKVRFLFGRENDSSGSRKRDFSLDENWKIIKWPMPTNNVDYSNIVAGFGLAVAPDIGTPDSVSIYIDYIAYTGTELAHDFSKLITGFNIVAPKNLNPDSAVIRFDNVYFDHSRLEEPRIPSSFLVHNNNPIFWSQLGTGHCYDASLMAIVLLAKYYEDNNPEFLNTATKIGDAFIFAMDNDRYFTDGRLRNVYAAGLHYDHNGKAKLPGYFNETQGIWIEDEFDVSTATGNMVWASLALISIFEATADTKYLTAAERLAQWCIDHTWGARGFTGGYLGWEGNQEKLQYTSTEHCIDLFAVFTRLFSLTQKQIYKEGAIHADEFVKSMWDEDEHLFYTGTDFNGEGINKSVVPVDVQFWYLMAFQEFTTEYIDGYWWAKENCLLENYLSSNYPDHPLTGFDFSYILDAALDGIGFEFSAQGAISACMLGDMLFYDKLITEIEYVQTNGTIANGNAIPAADHNGVSTGFSWEYHNILHYGGATSWYWLAKNRVNPYYNPKMKFNCPAASSTAEIKLISDLAVFPNPTSDLLCIRFNLLIADELSISILDLNGRHIKYLAEDRSFNSGVQYLFFSANSPASNELTTGMYILSIRSENGNSNEKFVFVN